MECRKKEREKNEHIRASTKGLAERAVLTLECPVAPWAQVVALRAPGGNPPGRWCLSLVVGFGRTYECVILCGEAEKGGHDDTRKVVDTLTGTVKSLSCSF